MPYWDRPAIRRRQVQAQPVLIAAAIAAATQVSRIAET
jgi:hypothetical protein